MNTGISKDNDELEQGMLAQPTPNVIWIEEGPMQSPMPLIATACE